MIDPVFKNPLFPDDIIFAAQASQAKWQIPASLTLAQWAVESNYGKAMPKGSNNPFGIKALPGQPTVTAITSEDPSGSNKPTGTQPFRKFASLEEAFDVHGRLLGSGNPYHAMVTTYLASPKAIADINRLANALTGVYAMAQNYGATLISVMTRLNLYQYDKEKPMTTPASTAAAAPAPAVPAQNATQLTLAYGSAAKDALVMLDQGIDLVFASMYAKYVPALIQAFVPSSALTNVIDAEFTSLEVSVAGQSLTFDTHIMLVKNILLALMTAFPALEAALQSLPGALVTELKTLGVLKS